MTTKAPSKVKEFPADSLEKIAYNSAKDVPTVEPNDASRLGYHIWIWLKEKECTLADAVNRSEARLLIPKDEAVKIIREALLKFGVQAEF
jgi:hypothetical protein